MVAIDSVAALTPKAELEGEMGDSHVGLQARMMSQAMRKLAGTLNRTETICIFTNQLREKIGVMFGNPETTPGGRALKFYSSVRLDIRRIETLKEGVEAVGNRVRVKVAKNKVAPPFKLAEFDIMYGSGISWEGTVLDAGLERKVVQKSGSYFSFEDERLGQGRQNATAFLREHPDVTDSILQRIQAQLGDDQVVSARLLPIAEPADQEKAAKKKAAAAAAAGEEPGRPDGRGRGARRGVAWRSGAAGERALDVRPGARAARPLGRVAAGEADAGRRSDGGAVRRGRHARARRATSTTRGSPRDRAEHLARGRGYGDEWIRGDLEAQGALPAEERSPRSTRDASARRARGGATRRGREAPSGRSREGASRRSPSRPLIALRTERRRSRMEVLIDVLPAYDVFPNPNRI